jgi:hypothetical protein
MHRVVPVCRGRGKGLRAAIPGEVQQSIQQRRAGDRALALLDGPTLLRQGDEGNRFFRPGTDSAEPEL